jgi:(2Fe-2S) ferredoxin
MGKGPKVKAHQRHILVCTDGDCTKKKKAKKTIKAFRRAASKARKGKNGIAPVLCGGMSCPGPCKKGPIVVVWPDGVWYYKVKKKTVEKIVERHLVEGKPYEKRVFYEAG